MHIVWHILHIYAYQVHILTYNCILYLHILTYKSILIAYFDIIAFFCIFLHFSPDPFLLARFLAIPVPIQIELRQVL